MESFPVNTFTISNIFRKFHFTILSSVKVQGCNNIGILIISVCLQIYSYYLSSTSILRILKPKDAYEYYPTTWHCRKLISLNSFLREFTECLMLRWFMRCWERTGFKLCCQLSQQRRINYHSTSALMSMPVTCYTSYRMSLFMVL